MFVADGGGLEEIISIFFCFGLCDAFLDVRIESDCFVQIDGFLVIEVDVVEDLF